MKTITEAANEFAGCNDKCTDCKVFDMPNKRQYCHKRILRVAFGEGFFFANQWICVEDELPEEYQNTLVKVKRFNVTVEVAYCFQGKWYRSCDNEELNVTAWRSL